jgi:hypothetical protein
VADADGGADARRVPGPRGAADGGRVPEGGRGPEGDRGPHGGSEPEGASEAQASRADGGQEGTRIGDTLSMMLDRLRDAAAAHDQDCAQDKD